MCSGSLAKGHAGWMLGRSRFLLANDLTTASSWMLGHTFHVDRHWLHRLVRAEVDLNAHQLRIFALRRREPTDQPLLKQIPYILPSKPFKE